jgi:hypothetical protein
MMGRWERQASGCSSIAGSQTVPGNIIGSLLIAISSEGIQWNIPGSTSVLDHIARTGLDENETKVVSDAEVNAEYAGADSLLKPHGRLPEPHL